MVLEKGLSYGTNPKEDINLYEVELYEISGPLLCVAAVGHQITMVET